MKITVAIPNNNQHGLVWQTIGKLMKQSLPPVAIYVLSDAKPFWKIPVEPDEVVPINNVNYRDGDRNDKLAKCDRLLELWPN